MKKEDISPLFSGFRYRNSVHNRPTFFYPTIAAPVNTEAKAPSITRAGSCS